MAVQQRYEANTRQAIDAGVFGAPSYGIAGEIFWARTGSTLLNENSRSGKLQLEQGD